MPASPKTERGARKRAILVAAARTVFERDGYLDARLKDITDEAGSAIGSFYTYFTDKKEIFAAVLAEIQEEMLHPRVRESTGNDDPVALIEAANRAYLIAYQRNAKLMRLLEEVATIDDDVRDLRRTRNAVFTERNAEAIRALQDRGLADQSLDPLLAANALSLMVSRTAYVTYVFGDSWDFEHLVDTLTRLWANALRIPQRI